jgi:hypothetical protein
VGSASQPPTAVCSRVVGGGLACMGTACGASIDRSGMLRQRARESFLASSKTELVADRVRRLRAQLKLAVVEYGGRRRVYTVSLARSRRTRGRNGVCRCPQASITLDLDALSGPHTRFGIGRSSEGATTGSQRSVETISHGLRRNPVRLILLQRLKHRGRTDWASGRIATISGN